MVRIYHRTGIASVGFVGFPSVGKVCVYPRPPAMYLSASSVNTDVKAYRDAFRGVRD